VVERVVEGGWLTRLPESRLLLSFWGALLAVDAGMVAGVSRVISIVLVAVVVAACSARQRAVVAVPIGFVGWLVVTGFVINDYGELALTGSGDLWRLVALLAMALVSGNGGKLLDEILTRSARVEATGRRTFREAAGTERIESSAVGDR
jgi:hypothetical protein